MQASIRLGLREAALRLAAAGQAAGAAHSGHAITDCHAILISAMVASSCAPNAVSEPLWNADAIAALPAALPRQELTVTSTVISGHDAAAFLVA